MMAKGLASLGRGGDSMLVHMSPREVAGLQKLALSSGGSLSINPETGLVEAGWLKSMLPFIGGLALDAFAPNLAGSNQLALSIGTGLVNKAMGGSWSDAFSAGLGMFSGLETGQELGRMGAKVPLADTTGTTGGATPQAAPVSSIDIPKAPPSALEISNVMTPNDITYGANPAAGAISASDGVPISGGNYFIDSSGSAPIQGTTTLATSLTPPVAPPAMTAGENMWAGAKQFAAHPITTGKEFYSGLGEGSNLARGAALMGGIGSIGNTINAYNLSHMNDMPTTTSENQWYVPAPGYKSLWRQGRINPHVAQYGYLPQGEQYYLDQGWNPGVYTKNPPTFKKGGLASLQHFDTGGPAAVANPANRPVITTDATVSPPSAPQVTNDTQALGDLHQYYRNMLEQSRMAPHELNQPTPTYDATDAYLRHLTQMITPSAGGAGSSSGWQWNNGSGSGSGNGNGITVPGSGNIIRNPNTNLNTGSGIETIPGSYYNGSGGSFGGFNNGWTPPTPPTNPTNPNDPNAQLQDIKVTAQKQYPKVPFKNRAINAVENMGLNAILPGLGTARGLYQSWNSPSSNKLRHVLGIPDYMAMDPNGDPSAAKDYHIPIVDNNFELPSEQAWLDNTLNSNYEGFNPPDVNPGMNYSYGLGTDPIEDVSGNGVAYAAHGGPIHHMAQGGLGSLGGAYAAGGKLLRGPGDGMSDSIPAVIGGQRPQRAALADGEFVIPADVVSHLGNGSTEAGSRKLYQMMDKIRYARTGNKKQGKQINPNKFLPVR
jgi:hypothetical protein